jgi:hypothetical protein
MDEGMRIKWVPRHAEFAVRDCLFDDAARVPGVRISGMEKADRRI